MSALDTLADVLSTLGEATFTPEVVAALNAFACSEQDDHPGAVRELIPTLSAPGAGVLAVWLGGAVERGHIRAEPSIEVLLDALRAHGRTLDLHQPSPATLSGMTFLGQGLVAHLAACPDATTALGEQRGMLAELEDLSQVSVGALWVHTLLSRSSGDMVVLHGAEPVGAVVRYTQVGTCFHLFSLLQGVLHRMPGAQVPSPEIAHALTEGVGGVQDQAWWHYGLADTPSADLAGTLWGESLVSSIPVVDGVQVVLLWAPIMGSRSWNSDFFGPVLEPAPSSIEVVRWMEAEEVATWRSRLGLR